MKKTFKTALALGLALSLLLSLGGAAAFADETINEQVKVEEKDGVTTVDGVSFSVTDGSDYGSTDSGSVVPITLNNDTTPHTVIVEAGINSPDEGISVESHDNGDSVKVTVEGNITADSQGIDAVSHAGSSTVIEANGSVEAGGTGIEAEAEDGGSVTISVGDYNEPGTGSISAGGTGIKANADGGSITVKVGGAINAGESTGDTAIDVSVSKSGSVSIEATDNRNMMQVFASSEGVIA